MKTKVLRKLLSLISDRDTEWEFQEWNTGSVLHSPYYGILSAGHHLGIHVEVDGKRGNVLAAYVAECSPEKIHQLLEERDELLEACKNALIMLEVVARENYAESLKNQLRKAIFNAEYEPKPIERK